MRRRPFLGAAFVVYALLMLWMMLYGRIGTANVNGYAEYLRTHVSLVPLRFIVDYINAVPRTGMYNVQLRNIIGNTVLFLPLGLFLPGLFANLRRYGRFIISVAAIITVIELLQLFLALGSLDIDDILLNCVGATVGFFGCLRLTKE